MGGQTWNGIYLKARPEAIGDALELLTGARQYRTVARTSPVDPATIHERCWEAFGHASTMEAIILLPRDESWTQLIGLELVDSCVPRLFHSSELVMLLRCDAFECGYFDHVGWWYFYYEQGRLVDGFHSGLSEPVELFSNLRDPNNIIDVYCKSRQYIDWERGLPRPPTITLPAKVISQFQGHPERLAPILTDGNTEAMREILAESSRRQSADDFDRDWPEQAILRMSRIVIWHDFATLHLSAVATAVPLLDSELASVYELMGKGKPTLLLFEHPKKRLLGNS